MLVAEQPTKKREKKIPQALIYEMMDGKPIYYRGYKEVLAGKKKIEDIMASSTLQSFIISHLLKILFRGLSDEKYTVLTNEIGVHIGHRNNLANDIAIFDKKVLGATQIQNKYADVPCKVAVEVDTEADLSETSESGYIIKKSTKLLDFGVEKVIWILTDVRKVIVFEPNKDGLIKNWNEDIELLENLYFNIGKHLENEGIKLEAS